MFAWAPALAESVVLLTLLALPVAAGVWLYRKFFTRPE